MTQKDIARIFNRFAGKEIQVVELNYTETLGGKSYTFNEAHPVKNEPTIKAMRRAAEKSGLVLRLRLPGMIYTADYRTDRVNVHIGKAPDGKWRVGKDFKLG